MSTGPLQNSVINLFPWKEFVPVMLEFKNILANTHFSVNAVVQFNTESVMRGNTAHIKLRLLYDVIS